MYIKFCARKSVFFRHIRRMFHGNAAHATTGALPAAFTDNKFWLNFSPQPDSWGCPEGDGHIGKIDVEMSGNILLIGGGVGERF